MKLFGTSGIRGVINKKITSQLTMDVGRAIGSIYDRIILGWDQRTSSEMMKNALMAGLLSTGCEVDLAGTVATPTLAFATRHFDAGIMITASHNPPQYNGIKLWNPDGMAFDTEQMEEVEEIIFEKKFRKARWDEVKNARNYHGAIEEHMEAILKDVKESKLKVVIDCASGVGATITPFLLQKMGCDVVTLNSQLDGHFPGRDPEPTDKSLADLKKIVKESDVDMGLAHDGDADRLVVVDKKGNLVSADRLLALIGKKEARKGIVVPVNASICIDDYVDVEVKRSRVGDVFVAEEMKKCGADFGGEPSGTWIFPSFSYCPDGIYAAAKIVSIDGKLSDLLKEVPAYPMLRSSIKCFERERVMKIIEKNLASLEIETIDGIRLASGDGWVLIRPSGTEPLIRITTEGRNEKNARELHEKGKKMVMEAMK